MLKLSFTLKIILNFIVTFLLKSPSQIIIQKKVGKKVMHCWDSNQRPLTYEKLKNKKEKKKERTDQSRDL